MNEGCKPLFDEIVPALGQAKELRPHVLDHVDVRTASR